MSPSEDHITGYVILNVPGHSEMRTNFIISSLNKKLGYMETQKQRMDVIGYEAARAAGICLKKIERKGTP